MSEASRKLRTMSSFQDTPPEIAYLDPSFLLNVLVAESTYHAECVAFASRLESARTVLVLSNLGLDEIWFVLLRVQAVQEHGERGWLAFLKDNPERVSEYTHRLEEATLQILEIPGLLLVELTTSQSLQALSVMNRYGLLPRDALHAAAVFETGIDTIITTDADFARVDGLHVYTCNPKALRMTPDTGAG
jgi:predicted nucleic acid-binding protein